MLEDFNVSNNDIFPVCVMATMSAGKSTFLNSILGEEILPEKNEACTARALAVIDDDKEGVPRAYIVKKDGTKGYVEINTRLVMEKVNSDENVKNVLVKMNLPSIHNTSKPLVLIDTPGVNNSEDIRHAERTKDILNQMEKGIIIYLLNATQLATNDDALLLKMVSDHIKKQPRLDICFILNKIDMLDEERESIPDTIKAAKKYISDFGLGDCVIYPLSALSAKVLRLKLNGRYMTKSEQRHLIDAYEDHKAIEKNMLRFADIYHELNQSFLINGTEVSEYELKRAIENTGITGIEKQIMDFVLNSERCPTEQIFNTQAYREWEGVYSPKRKAKNTKNYTGKIKWICKACRQVNGENDCCMNCGKRNVVWCKG